MGVSHVLSQGTHLQPLAAVEGQPLVKELDSVAPPKRSNTFEPPTRKAPVAILQGTAGSTGVLRTVQLSPDAVLANLRGLNGRIGVTPDDDGHAVLGEPIEGMSVRIEPRDDDSSDVGEIMIRGSSMMSGIAATLRGMPTNGSPQAIWAISSTAASCVWARQGTHHHGGSEHLPRRNRAGGRNGAGLREGAVVAVGVGERSIRPGVVIIAEFRGPDEADVRAEVNRRVASECGVVPSEVVFVRPGTLPRTTSGKLRRLEVKHDLQASRAQM